MNNKLFLAAGILLALASGLRAQTTIDFDFYPGPDGVLGTADDVPVVAPGLFADQLEQLTDQYASLGINFTPNPPVDDSNEILESGSFNTPPSHTPPNLLASSASAVIEATFSVPVTSVTALIGISGGADEMEIFDAAGISLGSAIGDDEDVTLTSTTLIARMVVRPSGSTTPAIDNLTFEGSGFALTATGSCPGSMTFSVSGETAGGQIAFLYGPPGSFTQGGSPCAGTVVDVNPPTIAQNSTATSVSGTVPAGACGTIRVQAVDISTCTVSNFIDL